MKIFFLAFVLLIFVCQTALAQSAAAKNFALYLLPRNIKSNQLSELELKSLKPEGKPVIAENDLRFYQKETHEFRINYEAAERLRKMRNELRGKPFAVFVGDEAVYAGAFWTMIWSSSFDGVVIDIFDLKDDCPKLKLALGYPSPEWFKGTDLRADERILKALETAGKLYEEVEMIVKCRRVTASGKRRPSSVFLFDVVSVTKGNFNEKEITFELFDGELLPELDAKRGWGAGENVKFNPNQEMVLKISRQTGREKPDWFLVDYRKK